MIADCTGAEFTWAGPTAEPTATELIRIAPIAATSVRVMVC